MNRIKNKMKKLKKTNKTVKPIKPIKAMFGWFGGKSRLVSFLVDHAENKLEKAPFYCEPFLGSGSFYLKTQHENSFLSDSNRQLIFAWKAVRDNPEYVIEKLWKLRKKHLFDENIFYKVRSKINFFIKKEQDGEKLTEKEKLDIGCFSLYLFQMAFSNHVRYDRKGFNVCTVKKESTLFRNNLVSYLNTIISKEKEGRIYNISKLINSSHVKIKNLNLLYDSEYKKIPIIKKGFYYLDPPYYESKHEYTKLKFLEIHQKKLSDFCKMLDEKGCCFMLSNSNTEFIRFLYGRSKFNIVDYEFTHLTKILSKENQGEISNFDVKAKELLIKNF